MRSRQGFSTATLPRADVGGCLGLVVSRSVAIGRDSGQASVRSPITLANRPELGR